MQRAIVVASNRFGARALASLLASGDFKVAATVGSDDRGLVKAARSSPDLALIDLKAGPGVLDVLDTVRSLSPRTVSVVLANDDDHAHVVASFQHGARGLLSRQRSSAELLQCIRTAAEGQTVIDPRLAAPLVMFVTRGMRVTGPHGLTAGEEQVVAQLPRGLTNAQIASVIGVTSSTVGTHLRHAFSKIGVRDRVAAAEFALEHGLA